MTVSKEHFLEIIEQHQGIINSLCAAWFPNIEDRNDARQDIILQLWKAFPSFREEAAVSTWMYKVSLNTILGKQKKEKRYSGNTSLEHAGNLSWNPADDDIQLLRQIIQSLAPADRALIILYLEGYKNKEIAGILGLTVTNTSTRMSRIKTILKARFNIESYAVR